MAEEHRLPVGRPDFKSGEMHACVSGRFDSCLFRHRIQYPFEFIEYNLWTSSATYKTTYSQISKPAEFDLARRCRRRSSFTLRNASSHLARPSGVVGPLLVPPCMRHLARLVFGRSFSRSHTAGARHGGPRRVFAPHRGRRCFGVMLPPGLCENKDRKSVLISRPRARALVGVSDPSHAALASRTNCGAAIEGVSYRSSILEQWINAWP